MPIKKLTFDGANRAEKRYLSILQDHISKICNSVDLLTKVVEMLKRRRNYSESEQKAGYLWIDGKDIWWATIDFGALPNNTSKQVLHGFETDSIIELNGFAYSSSTGFTIPLPYVYEDLTGMVQLDHVSGGVRCKTNADFSGYNGYVYMYYTK